VAAPTLTVSPESLEVQKAILERLTAIQAALEASAAVGKDTAPPA
jgi:hypothetical protein